jgi:hypothetical protein
MIALYRFIIADTPIAIHRTALTPDGKRIDKMTLGPTGEAAIKLTRDAEVAESLTVGEGIETVLAGMAFGFRPAWALGSAVNLKKFPVFSGVETLVVLVDHDHPDLRGRTAGQEAAEAVSHRWRMSGREVLRVMPRERGKDMADLIGGGV